MDPAEPQSERAMAELLAVIPFAVMLGVELVSATANEVVARLRWREDLCTACDALNGGALMSLADNAGGMCAFLNLPAGAGTATISSSTNFLRGVREGSVTASSRPLRVGRTVIVVETELRDDNGRLSRIPPKRRRLSGLDPCSGRCRRHPDGRVGVVRRRRSPGSRA